MQLLHTTKLISFMGSSLSLHHLKFLWNPSGRLVVRYSLFLFPWREKTVSFQTDTFSTYARFLNWTCNECSMHLCTKERGFDLKQCATFLIFAMYWIGRLLLWNNHAILPCTRLRQTNLQCTRSTWRSYKSTSFYSCILLLTSKL